MVSGEGAGQGTCWIDKGGKKENCIVARPKSIPIYL